MFAFSFLFLCKLLLIISVSDAQNYDISQNDTLGNWTLGPEIRSVIPVEPPGFMITFTGVRTPNVDDPVIGYKLVIKELFESTSEPLDEYESRRDKLRNIDGFLQFSGPKMDLSHLFTGFYKGSPSEIHVPAIYREYVYRICVLGIKPQVHYKFIVNAFTKGLEGPGSMPANGYLEALSHFRSNNSRYSLHNYLPVI